MLDKKGDGPHPNKKPTQSGKHHLQENYDKLMFMPGHYNLSEEDSNINNIDKLNSTRLKNSVTRVTIKALYTTTHQE